MMFTGRTLMRIREALDLAKQEIHNQIGHCPDMEKYEEDVAELEEEMEAIQKICDRIDKRHPELFPE